MNDILLFWLSLSLSGSLVAFTLILLKPLLQRFSKVWQYYLWLLVILRLFIPFSPDVSFVGGLFQQAETHFPVQSETMGSVPDSPIVEVPPSPITPNAGIAVPQDPVAASAVLSPLKNHIWGAVWLITATILLIRKVVGYGQFLKAVKKGNKIIADGELPISLQTVRDAMGIRKKIPVCTNAFVRTPMLVGFMRPMIVLPSEAIPSPELIFIFRHELTHYRRMDFFYKWLVEITVCLHWFNPFAYWVRKQINQDCEFSCDETVVACLADTERRAYGETLLNSIAASNSGSRNVVSLSLNKDGKLIKKRLNAIMHYHRKPKWIIFVAAVLTSVLLCGTIFAGAYTAVAMEDVQTSLPASPIRISGKDIASGGKLSLGSQFFVSGTECKVLLTWTGGGSLTVLCTSFSGSEKALLAESGKATTFQIEPGGDYTISVRNDNGHTIGDVNGTIEFTQNTQSPQSQDSTISDSPNTSIVQTVTYENVKMRRYEGADGHPYIHDTKVNETTKKIVGYKYGMLAFDKDGNPLKINWWSLDTEAEKTYFYLGEASNEIAPAETRDVHGGWSLNLLGTDSSVEQIAYVLYCDREIKFADGTVWTNPDFDSWRSTYEGKRNDVKVLESYYPHKEKIILGEKPKTLFPALPTDYVKTSFNGVSIKGQGPVGVELVRSRSTNVTFELLNMDNEKNCTTKAEIVNGTVHITINHNAPNGINVNFGPDYKNVVRVYIPNALYTMFDIQSTEMVVKMQDFSAPVRVESQRAGFWLMDTVISQGTYDIKVKSGPIHIEADTILKNITAHADSGLLSVQFNKIPTNLFLDSTNCGPVAERPNSWPSIYKVGNGTPEIVLYNTGKTTIEVQNSKH